ncbi:MAG: Mth938-like domain-containing protein [Gammaproteobacteria bacterium]|nr:Mth938-like domain-containing protein [Gammaproteobacteria bacterium]
MKLHLADTTGLNSVSSYTDGEIVVNDTAYRRSLIITPDQLISDWSPQRFDELTEQDLVRVADLSPELVILGTGVSLRFPDPRLTLCLTRDRVGVEVMDSRAACRTYNILAAEGRRVAAALLIGS